MKSYFLLMTLLICAMRTKAQVILEFTAPPNLPVIDISAGLDQQISSGQTVTLGGSPTVINAINPITIKWEPAHGLSNPNSPNPTVTPDKSTIYTVTVANPNCSSSKSVTITVDGIPVGITKEAEASVKLFPNPSSGTFYISSDFLLGTIVKLQVFNYQGVMVYEDVLYSSNGLLDARIDLPDELKGMLFIKVASGDHQMIDKIVVE